MQIEFDKFDNAPILLATMSGHIMTGNDLKGVILQISEALNKVPDVAYLIVDIQVEEPTLDDVRASFQSHKSGYEIPVQVIFVGKNFITDLYFIKGWLEVGLGLTEAPAFTNLEAALAFIDEQAG